jgi:hypothetical protein
MVCRVSAEEAERSRMQRGVLGTTPSHQQGEVLAMTERGHAYRINAETIAMTATNTYDHVQNVAERLAGIEPQEVLSRSQAQEVVTQNANERGSMPMDRFEEVPSAWEIGRGAEAEVDMAEGVASRGVGMVIALGEGLANAVEGSLFGGASRKAPGGAEYVPPAAAGPPPPVVEKPPWLEKKEKLRTTSGVEATQDQEVKGRVEEKQGQSFGELFAEIQRNNEKAARPGSGRSSTATGTMTGIATESDDGGLTGGTGLPTRGRSARARWKAAAEQVTVRWLLRVERLLAVSSWRVEQDYRRAAVWSGLPLAGAVPAQEKDREREADGATAGEAKAAKRGFTRLFKFGRLKR